MPKITHEAGHFLGLGHEVLTQATMNASIDRGSTGFRTFAKDDMAGICAIYPPDRNAPDCPGGPEPLHGFSRYCGGEGETGTVRSALSTPSSGGCACTFDQSSGRLPRGHVLSLAALCVFVKGRFTQAKKR